MLQFGSRSEPDDGRELPAPEFKCDYIDILRITDTKIDNVQIVIMILKIHRSQKLSRSRKGYFQLEVEHKVRKHIMPINLSFLDLLIRQLI